MSIERTPLFKKAFKKRIASNSKLIIAVTRRIQLFEENPFHPLLRNHPLTGSLRGFRAFSVTGDFRIIYQPIDERKARFLDIGTHNQVY
jgi:addiction module RelE/StbE family toxin